MASPLSLRRIRSYLGIYEGRAPVVRLCLVGVANLKAGEARNRDIFAQLRNLGLDQLVDGDGVFFDEGLIVETDLFVKLRHAAFHNLACDLLRLALGDGARLLDFLL